MKVEFKPSSEEVRSISQPAIGHLINLINIKIKPQPSVSGCVGGCGSGFLRAGGRGRWADSARTLYCVLSCASVWWEEGGLCPHGHWLDSGVKRVWCVCYRDEITTFMSSSFEFICSPHKIILFTSCNFSLNLILDQLTSNYWMFERSKRCPLT